MNPAQFARTLNKGDTEKYTYEMNPCRVNGNHFEKCDETAVDISTWSVYRRGEDDLAEWLSDHDTKTEAVAEVKRLQRAQ